MLAFTLFSSNMGEGQVVSSNSDPDDWGLIAPGSVSQTLLETARGKLPEGTRSLSENAHVDRVERSFTRVI